MYIHTPPLETRNECNVRKFGWAWAKCARGAEDWTDLHSRSVAMPQQDVSNTNLQASGRPPATERLQGKKRPPPPHPAVYTINHSHKKQFQGYVRPYSTEAVRLRA